MFTKSIFLGIAAFTLVSFTNPKQTNQADTLDCPYNSTEIVASCTSGCYSVVVLGWSFALSPDEEREATRRLQNYCNSQSLVQTRSTAPSIL